ncbi:MAG: DUF6282 family protein, partial [Acidimicrobiales bacterium]
AGRAAALASHHRLRVAGGLALNSHVGGFNPAAAAAALRMGARVVWMPTQDARTQAAAGLPRLCDREPRAGGATYAAPPVDPSQEAPIRTILSLVAAADAVLATGHLSTAEAAWVVEAAVAAGVRRILLTHPSWLVPAMTAAEAGALADRGAMVEVTGYQLLHQEGMGAGGLAAFVRAVGERRVVLASDAGQTTSPLAPEVLARLVDELAAQGIDRGALGAMAGEVPATLVLG